MFYRLYIVFLLLLPLFTFAEEGLSWLTSKKDSPQKWAIVPAYSRNSTYSHIFGGRFFIYPTGDTGYYASLQANTNMDLFFHTSLTYQLWRENGDQFDFVVSYNGFSEPYYGEGSQTKAADRIDIPIYKVHVRSEYVFKIKSYLYGGAFFRFDYRKEKKENGRAERFPEELLVSGGALVRYDSRNSLFNPDEGEYYEIRSWLLSSMPSPVFLEGDVRVFFSLFDNFVLALKGAAGLTFVNPSSYLFRFSLGGPDLLRGYRLNRFRGENYYVSQTELRYTPIKFLTVVGFFDFGQAEDTLSLSPRYSYGGGFRFGLPPDYNKKIRAEIGVGEDQYNIVVSFGHPF